MHDWEYYGSTSKNRIRFLGIIEYEMVVPVLSISCFACVALETIVNSLE